METQKTENPNGLSAAAIFALFGEPTFSLPENEVKAKTGRMVARVTLPFGGLIIGSAVWCRERIDSEKGETEQIFSVRLPWRFDSGIKGADGDDQAAAAIRMAQEKVLSAFDSWLDKVESNEQAARKASQPRLVRKVKKAQPGPTANQAAVQTAAAVAEAATVKA